MLALQPPDEAPNFLRENETEICVNFAKKIAAVFAALSYILLKIVLKIICSLEKAQSRDFWTPLNVVLQKLVYRDSLLL